MYNLSRQSPVSGNEFISECNSAAGMLNLLDRSPEVVPEVFDKAHKAYELGRNSKFLLDYPLEERLDQPLEEVRKDLLFN